MGNTSSKESIVNFLQRAKNTANHPAHFKERAPGKGPAQVSMKILSMREPNAVHAQRPPKKRKRTFAQHKERLHREIRVLESGVAVLKTRALDPYTTLKADPILQEVTAEQAVLTSVVRSQQLQVAKMQSALSRCYGDQQSHPLYTRVCLTKNWHERRASLLGMWEEKLRTAYEFIMAPNGPTDPDPILFSENRFETTEGDFCCVRFETIQFPGVKSLKQVFDALSFYKSNMEIIISERLGHITVRDDYDTIDDYAYNTRVLSTNERGIVTEGNMVSFRHLFGEGDAGFGSETGIMAVDFVDEDALHPYISSQRVRRDVSAAIVLTASKKSKGSSSKGDDEVVVTMRRASFLKLHQPEFPLSELALEDLRDTGAEWCDVMVKTVRSIVYSTPY